MPDPPARGKAAARPGGGRPVGRKITFGPMVKRPDPLESTPPAFGEEAARHIGLEWLPSRCPRVIAMTAHASEGDRATYLASGMDDYLPKPFRLAALSAVLERWAGKPDNPVPPDSQNPAAASRL